MRPVTLFVDKCGTTIPHAWSYIFFLFLSSRIIKTLSSTSGIRNILRVILLLFFFFPKTAVFRRRNTQVRWKLHNNNYNKLTATYERIIKNTSSREYRGRFMIIHIMKKKKKSSLRRRHSHQLRLVGRYYFDLHSCISISIGLW